MSNYQQRVKTEKENLDDKIISLSSFIFSTSFVSGVSDKDERNRLLDQLYIMMEYSQILEVRIDNF